MAVLGSVVVLELWLDEDSIVLNLCSNGCKKVNQKLLLLGREVGSRLGVVDHGQAINGVSEHAVDVCAESSVVYQS